MIEAFEAARSGGAVISYDMNFRPSLWKFSGGSESAIKKNRDLVSRVDLLIGGVDDFQLSLGMKLRGMKENLPSLDGSNFEAAIPQVLEEFPNLKVIATTLRTPYSATLNDWCGMVWRDGKLVKGREYPGLEVYDRVGGGDGFVSGLIYSLLNDLPLEQAVNIALAGGALAMTTPGDNSMATKGEVERLAAGGNARTER